MAGTGQHKTGGRDKGTPNKVSGQLKDAILQAAEQAGGDGGLVGYLTEQAKNNPARFMPMLAKLLPIQIAEERLQKLNGPMDLNFGLGQD
jgi:hypothetical protein